MGLGNVVNGFGLLPFTPHTPLVKYVKHIRNYPSSVRKGHEIKKVNLSVWYLYQKLGWILIIKVQPLTIEQFVLIGYHLEIHWTLKLSI